MTMYFSVAVLLLAVISPCFAFPCNVKRTAVVGDSAKWPATRDANGKIIVLVPYTINKNLDSKILAIFEKVIATLKQKTCIQLVPRTNQAGYVEVSNGPDCSAHIGYNGRKRVLYLLKGSCEYYSTVMHEVLHILGFYHEQARSDRDNYVQIFEENIVKGSISQFDIKRSARTFSIPYDFKSVMHYKNHAFSKNGKPTIVAKEDASITLGGDILSAGDVSGINTLYNCPQKDIVQADYEIKVFTGDKWRAGTDAKVYIDLYENGQKNTGEVYLEGGNFEAEDVDTFKRTLPYMSKLSKIDIRHDNSGWFAGWYLAKVEIKIDHRGKKTQYTFNCNCWLDGNPNTKSLTPAK